MNDEAGKLIEPQPMAFSFSAPGWYVVAALALLLMLFAIYLLIRHYQNNRYRRVALQFLAGRERELSARNAVAQMVYETDMLVKRIAMARYGRHKVSGLRGRQWITFINSTWRERAFDDTDDQLLTEAIYLSSQPVPGDKATAFVAKAKRWIKYHKKHL